MGPNTSLGQRPYFCGRPSRAQDPLPAEARRVHGDATRSVVRKPSRFASTTSATSTAGVGDRHHAAGACTCCSVRASGAPVGSSATAAGDPARGPGPAVAAAPGITRPPRPSTVSKARALVKLTASNRRCAERSSDHYRRQEPGCGGRFLGPAPTAAATTVAATR